MKVIRYLEGRAPRWAVVDGDLAHPLDGEPWEGGVPAAIGLPLDGLSLLAPCAPSKIVGVGRNYRAHAREMQLTLTGRTQPPVADLDKHAAMPEEPLLFLKPPSAVLASGEPIVRPRGYERVDYEGELAVVIGRRAQRVKTEQAAQVIFGYTCFNDVTVRDLQKKDIQFTRAKGFDTFAPIGPCVATDLDPRTLRIATRVNGELKQEVAVAEMVVDVFTLVAFISRVMTLWPGDVIATGTPAGVGNLRPGDVVDIECAEIGTLHNPVIEEEPE
jgi:2-keto-4-pentenoate hydratase/2-oxohepta-3-ene-1,7-dioic acid hydratase in catechol pathway